MGWKPQKNIDESWWR